MRLRDQSRVERGPEDPVSSGWDRTVHWDRGIVEGIWLDRWMFSPGKTVATESVVL